LLQRNNNTHGALASPNKAFRPAKKDQSYAKLGKPNQAENRQSGGQPFRIANMTQNLLLRVWSDVSVLSVWA
jgi:hypothetical protein